MKILTIDDRPELVNIGGYFDQENEHIILTKDSNNNPRLLYDVAHEVKQKTPDPESGEKCVIFLNLFLECRDDDFNWQQDQAGIALLKFLRMMGVHQHVVLISPYSFEHLIQQDAGNYIIASKGVSLVEPRHDRIYSFREFEDSKSIQAQKRKEPEGTGNRFSFTNSFAKHLYGWMTKYGWIQEKKPGKTKKVEDKETVALHELADNTFDVNNLTEYLKSGFELPADERHNWANWWGIIQLCDVHRSAFPDELDFGNNKSYPGNIDKSLKSLKNFQLRKIYQTAENFHNILSSEIRAEKEEELNFWTSEIAETENSIQGLSTEIENLVPLAKDSDKGAQYDLRIKKNEKINKQNYLSDCENEKEKKFNELHRVLEANEQDVTEEYISNHRFAESEDQPSILYIDDQGHEGWSDIFQIMLYGQGNQSEDIFNLIHSIDDNIQSFYRNTIKPEIKKNNGPDVILLDLRLLNESGTLQNVHEVSGAKLLKYIREDFPGQPVMMTTASNKAWTVRELFKLGIDCYWTKEGIDVSQSLSKEDRKKYSADNYLSFLKNVNALSGNDYQLLKKVETLIYKILIEKQLWWEDPNWTNNLRDDAPNLYRTQIQTSSEPIIENLRNVLLLMRKYFYLVHFELKYEKKAWFYPSLILQHLGKIVEIIHSYEALISRGKARPGEDFHPNIKNVLGLRKDELGIKIYKKRNDASHYNKAKYLENNDVHEMVNWIYRYLLKTPECVADKK